MVIIYEYRVKKNSLNDTQLSCLKGGDCYVSNRRARLLCPAIVFLLHQGEYKL